MYAYAYVYTRVCIHTNTCKHTRSPALLRGPRSDDTPIGISTFTAHVASSQHHSLQKEPRLLGEMMDSTIGVEKVQDDSRKSCPGK